MIETEKTALKAGKPERAIYAAYDPLLQGDIAKEIVRGTRRARWTFHEADLANWKVN